MNPEQNPTTENDTTQIPLTELEISPSGDPVYFTEYREEYLTTEEIEKVKEHGIENQGYTSKLYIYIENHPDFQGALTLFDKEGIPQILLFSEDINSVIQLEGNNEKILRSSTVDPLTGVDNRRGWDISVERVSDIIQRGEINEKHITLAVFDLNNVKEMNDQQGHKQGDVYIVEMAKHLESILRPYDEIARWGGDEFATFAVSNRNIVDTMEKRLNQQRTPNLNYCAGILSFSIRSILEELENTPDLTMENRKEKVIEIMNDKFKQADRLLYEAKEIAKNETSESIKPTRIRKQITDTSQ